MMHYHCQICSHAFNSMHALCPDCNSRLVMPISSVSTSSSQQATLRPSIVDMLLSNKIPEMQSDIQSEFEVFFRQEIRFANNTVISSSKIIHGEVDCAICMENMLHRKITLVCRHSFHALCTLKWLRLQNTCPICRFVLFEI